MNNLLNIKLVGPLIRSRWFWRLLRLSALLLLLAMTAWGWHHHGIAGVSVAEPLMYSNLTSHLFWVWWIMGIVFVALLFGRGWCAVCPLGWLNGLTARLGFRRELPGWLRSFIPVTLVLILLQLFIYFFAIHRFPDYTAVLLAVLLLLAAGSGFLFRERSFCTLLCPAGALFGLYARIAPFQLRVNDQNLCAGCTSQRCIAEPVEWQTYQLGGTVVYRRRQLDGCPVGLVPSDLSDSADCTLCLNCLHNCDKDNVAIGFRSWLGDLKAGALRPGETFFFVVLLGLLAANFSKVNVALRELIFLLPETATSLLGWQEPGFYLLAVVWISLLFPLVLLFPGYLVYRLGQVRTFEEGSAPAVPADAPLAVEGFWEVVGKLAMPLIPLVLAAHAILALVKINAKAAFLPLALGDPSGIKSYLAINVTQTVTPPAVLFPLDIVKWLILLILLVGYLVSCRSAWQRRSALAEGQAAALAAVISATILFGLFLYTVLIWLFVR